MTSHSPDREKTDNIPNAQGMSAKKLSHDAEHIRLMVSVLKTGYRIIVVFCLLTAVILVASGTYWVPEGTLAVHSRLGMLRDNDLNAVKSPGGPYFAIPYPVDRIIRLPTTMRAVKIDKAFLLGDAGSNGSTGNATEKPAAFKPGIHGSLLTGDKNIVQSSWVVNYRINATAASADAPCGIVHFIKNTGTLENADHLIRVAVERSVVNAAAEMSVADFIAGRFSQETIRSEIQRLTDELNAGIDVVSLNALSYSAPAVLERDFQAVTQAESEKAMQIEKAMRYRTTTMTETAGEGWETLLEAIGAWDNAVERSDSAEIMRYLDNAENILLSSNTGGRVAADLGNARTEKTKTIEQARASHSRFLELYAAYRRDPHVCRSHLFEDALSEVLHSPYVKVRRYPRRAKILMSDVEPARND